MRGIIQNSMSLLAKNRQKQAVLSLPSCVSFYLIFFSQRLPVKYALMSGRLCATIKMSLMLG